MTLFGFQLPEVDWWGIVAVVKEWQDLTAAMIALGAALWTVQMMRAQIRQVDRHERERRRGPYEAARSMLPLVLNDVATWVTDHADVYKRTYASLPSHALGQPLISASQVPTIDQSTLNALQRMIEVEEDAVIRHFISQTIYRYQYMKSRLMGLANPGATTVLSSANHDTALAESVHLYAIMDLLYPYARRTSDNIDESRMKDALNNALGVFDLREGQFRRAGEEATRRIDRLVGAGIVTGRPRWWRRLFPDRLRRRG